MFGFTAPDRRLKKQLRHAAFEVPFHRFFGVRQLPVSLRNVAMRFRARGGKRAQIALRVTNAGAGHDLACELLSGDVADRP